MFAPKKEMFLPVGTKHENIMWEKEMKERIMSHARIVYADKLSPSSHFDIITALDKSGGTSRYRAHLLVINAPIGTDYKVVFSAHARNSVGDGLESMLEILQQKVAPLLKEQILAADKQGFDALSDNTGKDSRELMRDVFRRMPGSPEAKRAALANP